MRTLVLITGFVIPLLKIELQQNTKIKNSKHLVVIYNYLQCMWLDNVTPIEITVVYISFVER